MKTTPPGPPPLSPGRALQIVDQALALAPLNRASATTVAQAMRVLVGVVNAAAAQENVLTGLAKPPKTPPKPPRTGPTKPPRSRGK